MGVRSIAARRAPRELTLEEARLSRSPSTLEGPWYITRTAVAQYARIFVGDTQAEDIAEARRDLIEACRSAHRVKDLRPGVSLWRASTEWLRILLHVADAKEGVPGALPALIAVRTPYRGWGT